MKYKKLIIVSIILVVVGFLTSVITLATKQFNIGDLDSSLISKTYDINEEFNSIECELEISDLNIYLTTDNKNYALCLEKEKITFSIEVINNVLTIKENYKFDIFNYSNTSVDLYINKDTLEKLDVITDTGDICVIDAFKIKNINIKGSTNDVEFANLVSGEINIELSTGDTWIDKVLTNNITVKASTGDIELSNCKIQNNVNLKVTTGEVELSYNEIMGDLAIESDTGNQDLEDITCNNINLKVTTGDITLEDVISKGDMTINSDTGFVEFEYCDAVNIYITTSTGRVEGTILTSKIFDARSNTGNVNVPELYEGGICKIRTSTGKINIDVV